MIRHDDAKGLRQLADAQQDLLRTLTEGLDCLYPDEFQRDCGECLICRCRYAEGALKGWDWREAIPGTQAMKRRSAEARADLLKAMEHKAKGRNRYYIRRENEREAREYAEQRAAGSDVYG